MKTSEWLAGRLKAAGLQAEYIDWKLNQFFLDKSSLVIDGNEIESFPLWQPKATSTEGVRAPLVQFTPDGKADVLKGRIVVFSSALTAQDKWRRAWLQQIANGFRSQPNVEGWFLPDEVYAIFAARKQHDVPVIAGFNADEGTQLSFLAEYNELP